MSVIPKRLGNEFSRQFLGVYARSRGACFALPVTALLEMHPRKAIIENFVAPNSVAFTSFYPD